MELEAGIEFVKSEVLLDKFSDEELLVIVTDVVACESLVIVVVASVRFTLRVCREKVLREELAIEAVEVALVVGGVRTIESIGITVTVLYPKFVTYRSLFKGSRATMFASGPAGAYPRTESFVPLMTQIVPET